jgi:Zn-dependent peptidase ImmA (M78 family)
MTKSLISDKTGISIRSLGYYESGSVIPSAEAIDRLSGVLSFPTAFFFASDVEELASDAASFRALSKMTASKRDAALAAGSLAISLENWISERFVLPEPFVPSLKNFEPETAAELLRIEWEMGQRPIGNLVHLAESKGIRVFSLPVDSSSVDAFSIWHDEKPFVFLNNMKSGERSRMDLSHEIAHLCLHQHGVSNGRQTEQEADKFASAFLMPAKDVLARIPRNISLRAIQSLKARWKVSAIALVVRLRVLDVISEWQYRSFCIELSRTGQKTKEINGIVRESSQIIGKVFDALRSEGVSRNSIASDLAITPSELNSLIAGLTLSAVPEDAKSDVKSENHLKPLIKPELKLV